MAQRVAFDLTEEDKDETGGFTLIDEGTYDVEITDAEMQKSSKKGTLGYKIRYKSADESFKGRLFDDVWITAGTLLKGFKQFVKATGRGPVPTAEDQSFPEPDDLIGAELQVTVIHEEYEKDGETRKSAKVKGFSYKAIGSGGAKKADDGSFAL